MPAGSGKPIQTPIPVVISAPHNAQANRTAVLTVKPFRVFGGGLPFRVLLGDFWQSLSTFSTK